MSLGPSHPPKLNLANLTTQARRHRGLLGQGVETEIQASGRYLAA